MKKIVIIGASVAGHSVAVSIREIDKSCHIFLLTEGGFPLFDKRRLADLFSGRAKENDLFLCSEEFYQKENINFIKEAKVTAVNIDKKMVYCKGRGPLEYDLLIVCSGRKYVIPQLTGSRKEGVFTLNSLDEIRQFNRRLISEAVCVVGSNDAALEVASAVSSRNIDVLLLSSKELNLNLPHVEAINSPVAEIIGESEVQAVKLENGKIFSASAVIFADAQKSNIEFLKNTAVETSRDSITVDEYMRTNIPDVFACGSACRQRQEVESREKTWVDVESESRRLRDGLIKSLEAATVA